MNLPNWVFIGAWIGWAVVGVALEVMALVDRGRGDTLSELIWWLLQWRPLWFAALGLLVWATIHFLGFGRFG